MYIQIWDSPKWWIETDLNWFWAKIFETSFQYCLAKCSGFGAPSFRWEELYRKQYPGNCVTLIGIAPEIPLNIVQSREKHMTIRIGFAGQIYATDAYGKLIEALNACAWRIDNRLWKFTIGDIEIHHFYISRFFHTGLCRRSSFWKSGKDCDLLYCPYWFDPSFFHEASTSFPSKLATYLSVGIPVLFHGPEYSSPIKLLEKNGAAFVCKSTQASAIVFAIRKCLYSNERNKFIGSGFTLIGDILGKNHLNRSFSKLLGAE